MKIQQSLGTVWLVEAWHTVVAWLCTETKGSPTVSSMHRKSTALQLLDAANEMLVNHCLAGTPGRW